MNYGVIMAGGRGERFWPLSRIARPKQFLKLTSERTMLEETLDRVTPLIPLDNLRIVTTEDLAKLIGEEMPQVTQSHILAEPVGRNTCLAIGLAAVHLLKDDPEAVMVVLAADHLIRPAEKLLRILSDGLSLAAREDVLITIGIVPTRPDTGYGYIRFADEYRKMGDSTVFDVQSFAEKPSAAVAQEYYYSRKYFWNSGMFIWSARTIMNAIENCLPEMGKLLSDYAGKIGTKGESKGREQLYKSAQSISIDYAVLESATNVKVIKSDFVWDDVGSWNALERYMDRDDENNVLYGETAVLNTYETTVYNDGKGLIAAIGVSDLVVVQSGDVTLVVHKTQTAKVKELLARLSKDDSFDSYL